jgi:hypothetical protein
VIHSQWQTHQSVLEKPKWYHFARPIHFAFVLGILIVTLTSIWYFWTPTVTKQEDIPIIRPAPGPIRLRPDNPGAPDIPHQDKLIYDELTGKYEAEDETSIREEIEEPLDIKPDKIEEEKEDKYPIADLKKETAEILESEESFLKPFKDENNSGVHVVVSHNDPDKEVNISLQKKDSLSKLDSPPHSLEQSTPNAAPDGLVENETIKDLTDSTLTNNEQLEEKKIPKLRSLPLNKLFSLNGGTPRSMQKNFKPLPTPKSQAHKFAYAQPKGSTSKNTRLPVKMKKKV